MLLLKMHGSQSRLLGYKAGAIEQRQVSTCSHSRGARRANTVFGKRVAALLGQVPHPAAALAGAAVLAAQRPLRAGQRQQALVVIHRRVKSRLRHSQGMPRTINMSKQ